jgi:hypothetical protein
MGFRHIERVRWEEVELFATTGVMKMVKLRSVLCLVDKAWKWRTVLPIRHRPAEIDPTDPTICPKCLEVYALESLEWVEAGGEHPRPH